MAMHGRQVRVAATDDGVVAVQRDVIIDRERGIAAEVEKVVVAVDLGDGNIAVAEQQRVKAVQFLDPPPRQQAIAYQVAPTVYGTTSYSGSGSSANEQAWIHLVCCLVCLFFPPWIVCWLLYCCVAADG